MENELKKIIVSRQQLTEIFGFKNQSYLNELVNDAGLPKLGHNEYPLIECLKWYVMYQKGLHEKEVERIKQSKPADDLARKNSELKQIQIDLQKSKLIEKDVAVRVYGESVKILAKALDAFPNRVSNKLTELNEQEIKNILQQELDALRNEFVESINKL